MTTEPPTPGLTGQAMDEPAPVDTARLADEIGDLIFKVCTRCHSAFGGDLDECPEDGSRLVEPSFSAHHSLTMRLPKTGPSGASVGDALGIQKYCPGCSQRFPLDAVRCDSCDSVLSIPTIGAPLVCGERAAAIDSVIAGKYRLLEDIGRGGYGEVYLAKHESLGKRFAIKMLQTELADGTAFRNHFHEEALKLSRLDDENIVKVFDFGEWNDCQYIAMEYVEGEELATLIYEETMARLRAARLMRQVARALAEAHAQKIVHLDLKPTNILVKEKRGEDVVKVIDFGIAEIYSDKGGSRQDSLAGTFPYMAPEQWRRGKVDPRTDIYSFGVIFYECLAGRRPFRQSRMSALEEAHCTLPPPPLRELRPDVPAPLVAIVERCLEKRPERRFASSAALDAALAAYIRREEDILRRWVWRAAWAAALVLLGVAGVLGVQEAMRDLQDPELTSFDFSGSDARVFPLQDPPGEYQTRGENVLEYQTRGQNVLLRVEGRDDREVVEFLVGFPPQDPEPMPAGDAGVLEVPIPPGVGKHVITIQAVDSSGRRSARTILTVDRLLPPDVRLKDTLRFTNADFITLRIEALVGKDLKISSDRFPEDQHELTSAEFPPAGKGIEIPVAEGENTILVRKIDILTGEKDVEKKISVFRKTAPLVYEVRREDGQALRDDEPLETASTPRLRLVVPGAAERFEPGTTVRVDIGDAVREFAWDAEDVQQGEIELKVEFPPPGQHVLRFQAMTDKFGNKSVPLTFTIDLDPDGPTLKLLDRSVTFYGTEPPSVRLQARDKHPVEDGGGWSLFRVNDSPVPEELYHVEQSAEHGFVLRLKGALFPTDGPYVFRVQVRDRLHNVSQTEKFEVLADHTEPVVDVVEPKAGTPFGRDDKVRFRVRIQDAFADQAWVDIEALDGTKKRFDLKHDSEEKVWRREVRVAEFGKPRQFTVREPGFGVVVTAADAAGRSTIHPRLPLRFAWESGDQLLCPRDPSIVLVYHEAVRGRGVRASFFLAATEVSNRQYRKFLTATDQPSFPQSPDWEGEHCEAEALDLPVRGLSVKEMQAYAEWAGLEIAAPGPWRVAAFWNYLEELERKFPWGDEFAPGGRLPVRCQMSSPVAVYEGEGGSTRLGVYHLFGNVVEFVFDRNSGDMLQLGGAFDTKSWVFDQETPAREQFLREREVIDPGQRPYNLGFRCMLWKGDES